VFSANWWNRKLRIASDSAFGIPTILRVKPEIAMGKVNEYHQKAEAI